MNAQNFPFIINIYTIISITTTLQHLFVHEERDFQVHSVNQLISQSTGVSAKKRNRSVSLYVDEYYLRSSIKLNGGNASYVSVASRQYRYSIMHL